VRDERERDDRKYVADLRALLGEIDRAYHNAQQTRTEVEQLRQRQPCWPDRYGADPPLARDRDRRSGST
jgi:hypothetical protein